MHHILGIAGSIRTKSLNRALLEAAQHLAPADVSITIAQIDDIPHYNDDHDSANEADVHPAVNRVRQQIRSADSLLIATPEYNHSFPGVLKNALDWASRPYGKSALQGKAVAVIGGGGGSGGIRAQVHLRQTLSGCGMYVMARPEMAIRFGETFKDGELVDHNAREHLAKVIGALVAWHHKIQA